MGIEQYMADLPDGRLIMSLPHAGKVCAAQMLAELGDVRGRFQTSDQSAAEARGAPVTYQNGKVGGAACNKRLRRAITRFASVTPAPGSPASMTALVSAEKDHSSPAPEAASSSRADPPAARDPARHPAVRSRMGPELMAG